MIKCQFDGDIGGRTPSPKSDLRGGVAGDVHGFESAHHDVDHGVAQDQDPLLIH
jgi:hypothetical protein